MCMASATMNTVTIHMFYLNEDKKTPLLPFVPLQTRSPWHPYPVMAVPPFQELF